MATHNSLLTATCFGPVLVPAKMLAVATAAVILSSLLGTASSDESVRGVNLGKCDRSIAHDPNWSTTGYMRGDYCTATSSDAGSHYICVDLPDAATDSGQHYSPFWVETGQSPNGEDAASWPLAGPWCICMWAFRSMYAQHPDFVDMIDCASTNSWVVENYDLDEPALAAVCRKCNVAGVSPDEALRSKCIAAGVAAAPGTGRPEDFDKTTASAPTGDSNATMMGGGMSFTSFFVYVIGLVMALACCATLVVMSRAKAKPAGAARGEDAAAATALPPSSPRAASNNNGNHEGLSEPINVSSGDEGTNVV